MAYREQITVALIRDNGERRSWCLPRGLFRALVVFFVLLVPLCAVLLWQTCGLWQENAALTAALDKAEQSLGTAQATAQRLHDLEVLLEEERLAGREHVLRNLMAWNRKKGGQAGKAPSTQPAQAAQPAQPQPPQQPSQPAAGDAPVDAPANAPAAAAASADGAAGPEAAAPADSDAPTADKAENPAQQPDDGADEQFQGVDLGYVKVSNVTARQVHARRLRIALDLRNTEKQAVASGTVEAILLTADGERTNLEYTVEDAGHFRISSFKRAVLISRLASHQSLANAQVLLEVRNHEHTLVYSNLYPVEH